MFLPVVGTVTLPKSSTAYCGAILTGMGGVIVGGFGVPPINSGKTLLRAVPARPRADGAAACSFSNRSNMSGAAGAVEIGSVGGAVGCFAGDR